MNELVPALGGFGCGVALSAWVVWLWIWPLRCRSWHLHAAGAAPAATSAVAGRDIASYAEWLARDDLILSVEVVKTSDPLPRPSAPGRSGGERDS